MQIRSFFLALVCLPFLLTACNAEPPRVLSDRIVLSTSELTVGQPVSISYRVQASGNLIGLYITANRDLIFRLDSASPQQHLGVSFSWTPETSGEYRISPFVVLVSGTEVITQIGTTAQLVVQSSDLSQIDVTPSTESASDLFAEMMPQTSIPSPQEGSSTDAAQAPAAPVSPSEPSGQGESASRIEPTDPPEQPRTKYTVIANVLNVRSAPSKQATILLTLNKGESIELLETQKSDLEWGRIRTEKGQEGWVALEFIRPGSP